MGHYRSEMVSQADEIKAAKENEKRLKQSAKKIQKRINEVGIARVLAEYIDEPTLFAIYYR